MTGGFGDSGHDDPANRPPGGSPDPEQTMWGGAATPPPPPPPAPWEPPPVEYPATGDHPMPNYPPPDPASYGGASYPSPYPPAPPPPPPPYIAPSASVPFAPNYYAAGNYAPGYYAPVGTNGLAIGSLVTSIFSLLCCQIVGIVSLILGIVALNQIKQTNEGGRGLAIAGVVLSGLSIAFMILIVIVAATRPAGS